MKQMLGQILHTAGIDAYGICRLSDCLPLIPCRAVSRIPREAVSVIALLLPYYIGAYAARNVARYAIPPDYHHIAGTLLNTLTEHLSAAFPAHLFASFVDNSPIGEVTAAKLAGLGVVGCHGQLIHPVYGTHVFICTIVTTLDISPTGPLSSPACLQCGRCIAACPTGALGKLFCKERCRSHITQKKGALSSWEETQIQAGGFVWGCDLCTDVCPMNTGKLSPIRAFYQNPAPLITLPQLDHLLGTKAYGYRGRAVLERNLQLLCGSNDNIIR